MPAYDWSDPVLLHFRCAASELAAAVPAPLAIREVGGSAWVTALSFVAERWRLAGRRGPRVPQLELLTYVDGPLGAGGYLLGLDVDSALGAAGASLMWASKAERAELRTRHWGTDHRVEVRRGGEERLTTLLRELAEPAAPEADAAALLELPRMYAGEAGNVRCAALTLGPWRVAPCDAVELSAPAVRALAPGATFGLAQVAERVEVEQARPVRVR